jgi:hypothetical protein
MLGSSCSPCCGCSSAYDQLRSKTCVLTLGGEIPAHPGATVGFYQSKPGYQGTAIKISNWSPERVVQFLSFGGGATLLTETSNWYVIAPQYRFGGLQTNQISDDTLKNQVAFDKSFVIAYKKTESPIGSHSLALDVGKSYFYSNSGLIVFTKVTDDYQITCNMSVSQIDGACAVLVTVTVKSFWFYRSFDYSVTPTYAPQSAALSTKFLEANGLPYEGGAITADSRSRQYVPGTYNRFISYFVAPMYVQLPQLLPTYNQTYAQFHFDRWKTNVDSYASVWPHDLSQSTIGDWSPSSTVTPNRQDVGTFSANARYTYSDLIAGNANQFTFINGVLGIPTFIPSSTKPSPYSFTHIDIDATVQFEMVNAGDKVNEYAFPDYGGNSARMSGPSAVTFHNYTSFAGLTSTSISMQ